MAHLLTKITGLAMFKFELGQQISIKSSGEKGAVEACAKYIASGNHYYIHYRAADGRAVTKWFEEHHIEVCDQNTTESTDSITEIGAQIESLIKRVCDALQKQGEEAQVQREFLMKHLQLQMVNLKERPSIPE